MVYYFFQVLYFYNSIIFSVIIALFDDFSYNIIYFILIYLFVNKHNCVY